MLLIDVSTNILSEIRNGKNPVQNIFARGFSVMHDFLVGFFVCQMFVAIL